MISSILDSDLYKFTMQQSVLEHYPAAWASYAFINRGGHQFTDGFAKKLRGHVDNLRHCKLTSKEKTFLAGLGFFKPQYLEYLANYRFDPSEVSIADDMSIIISGPWHSAILWEVPLMALISELFFSELTIHKQEVHDKALSKAKKLAAAGCAFAEFGTRRRRSRDVHETVLNALIWGATSECLVGTSNVDLAHRCHLKPIGTMAHEWIMGVSALESLRYANRFALSKWKDTYKANLGIALTDTFGSDTFFRDFDLELAKVYDGVRHDSGDPFDFGEKVIQHYARLKIDPATKSIIFSDGLDVNKCLALQERFNDRIKIAFGIGTHLTNDFDDAKALNIVIKLRRIKNNEDNIPVVKLSDEPGKETGDPRAIEIANWTFAR